MDQRAIGSFIARKRKEKNVTQAALAERLGVSNKTVSKWETGKCMPDYSIIEALCGELDITVAELLDGEESTDNSVRVYDQEQILDLIQRTQALEHQRLSLSGVFTIAIGLLLLLLHGLVGGSDFRDFISGLLLGLSIVDMTVGIFLATKGFNPGRK